MDRTLQDLRKKATADPTNYYASDKYIRYAKRLLSDQEILDLLKEDLKGVRFHKPLTDKLVEISENLGLIKKNTSNVEEDDIASIIWNLAQPMTEDVPYQYSIKYDHMQKTDSQLIVPYLYQIIEDEEKPGAEGAIKRINDFLTEEERRVLFEDLKETKNNDILWGLTQVAAEYSTQKFYFDFLLFLANHRAITGDSAYMISYRVIEEFSDTHFVDREIDYDDVCDLLKAFIQNIEENTRNTASKAIMYGLYICFAPEEDSIEILKPYLQENQSNVAQNFKWGVTRQMEECRQPLPRLTRILTDLGWMDRPWERT